jgi:hypothetical protein
LKAVDYSSNPNIYIYIYLFLSICYKVKDGKDALLNTTMALQKRKRKREREHMHLGPWIEQGSSPLYRTIKKRK